MNELKSTCIRNQIRLLCEFCLSMVRTKTLRYDDGLTKSEAIKELEDILKQLNSGEFTIAFVGEYNSGKTTIINLLTDTRRLTGTDITTDDAQRLRWNDLWVIDTPGLGSGRQDHDTKTEEWLRGADLLVYVLTPDLFGSRAGERFLQMLDKYKREHEMMIVLNMIDKEGNDVNVFRDELQKALGSRPLGEYFPTFMSARDKEKSLDPNNPLERRDRLAKKSRFDTFIANLNAFVLDRKERASLTTPLTRLQVLMRKLSFATEFGKEDALLSLRMSTLEKALREVKKGFANFKDEMKDNVARSAGVIFDALENPPSDFDAFCVQQMELFQSRSDDVIIHLADCIGAVLENLHEENIQIEHSQLAQEVMARIGSSKVLKDVFQSVTPSPQSDGKENKISELLESVRKLAKLSGKSVPKEWADVIGSKNLVQAASKLVGMVNRDLILKVGRSLGYKFKPWEAVKLSSRFAKAVPLLNIAASGLDVVMHERDKRKREEAAQQLRQFKIEVKEMLQQCADDTIDAVRLELISNVETVLSDTLLIVREKKSVLATYTAEYKRACIEFEDRRTQCLNLYDEIYGNNDAASYEFQVGET